MELLSGFEPETSSLPRKCSTPELQEQNINPTPSIVSLETVLVRVSIQRQIRDSGNNQASQTFPKNRAAKILPAGDLSKIY